jgi:hypothetical protein
MRAPARRGLFGLFSQSAFEHAKYGGKDKD